MHELGTPGVSIAVIENFEVAWASGFGIRKVGERAEVEPDTPFQAGSISKPVFAWMAAEQVLHIMLGGGEKHVDARLVEQRVEPLGGERKCAKRGVLSVRTSSAGKRAVASPEIIWGAARRRSGPAASRRRPLPMGNGGLH
jgi:hypothetical protein